MIWHMEDEAKSRLVDPCIEKFIFPRIIILFHLIGLLLSTSEY